MTTDKPIQDRRKCRRHIGIRAAVCRPTCLEEQQRSTKTVSLCEVCATRKGKTDDHVKPDWTKKCVVCGATPIVPMAGMCGPCTFGEAETAGGNW